MSKLVLSSSVLLSCRSEKLYLACFRESSAILLTEGLNAVVFKQLCFLLTVESDLSLGEGEMAEPLPGENGGWKYKVV